MLRFAMKLQQLTGPVMAKGLEDTVFYIYNRLSALNEVGGEPERFGTTLETFHLRNQERAEKWPAALLASTTHDTKRSEDVRARLAVISEVPDEWNEHLFLWAQMNRRHKVQVGDRIAPDNNDEYLFYQTLVGAWPMEDPLDGDGLAGFRGRMSEYMLKAVREAKVNTGWLNPDDAYEEGVARFIDATLDWTGNAAFLDSAGRFKRRLQKPGQINSLAATVLKLASPGTTDVYQGAELWDLSLVDPDNRRKVDFAVRQQLLDSLLVEREGDRAILCERLLGSLDTGEIKLFTLLEGLSLKKRRESLFRGGDYRALDVCGPRERHAVAFVRRHERQWVVAVVPRWVTSLLDAAGGPREALAGTRVHLPIALENATLRDIFTGRAFTPERRDEHLVLDLGELLSLFPVALLEADIE
jgi:(1->4)-alpha-D-glucan 1-alpha-D-glucosylmutase